MTSLPRDDLAAIAAETWRRLARGAADSRAAFRQMQLATIGTQGWPEMRSVILRAADVPARRLQFHTDRRSSKAAEIAEDGRVALHFWDQRAQLQLRLWGQAAVEAGPAANAAWSRLSPFQRAVYAGPSPGRVLADPAEADRDGPPADADAGRANFVAVAVTVMRFEWLHLGRAGHRRARFDWQSGWQGRWLAP
jgi:hypothetical protein